MTVLTGARVVTPAGALEHGWVALDGDRIRELGSGEPPSDAAVHDLGGGWLLPGFVDMHVHGGGGSSFTTGDPDEARRVVEFHRRHGTTTIFASLVTAALPILRTAITGLSDLVDDGTLAGVHLEGPYLAKIRCGAHDPALLREPNSEELAALLSCGRGAVRQVTVAPELPGAVELIRQITDAGVVAAAGHTDATYAQARAAFDAGATVVTHLFNGMRPIHHREPGLITAALADHRVFLELINDGVHVHDAVVRATFAWAAGPRVALVTDAMAAAGFGDGRYRLGSQDVCVLDGVARLSNGTSIAGSTLTMDRALRHAVRRAGVSIVDAARAAATTPAAALGLDRVGGIAKGWQADLVVLDDDLAVRAVLQRGSWVEGPRP
ncbi:MAG: N-acetylglucosamine-6-phosphate deacetylase [Haloechinothrix sp.]